MRTIVYPNPKNFVMSAPSKQPLSAADPDALQLSDADLIRLTQIFLRKIPLCCLTQRAAKIVTAIFSQTIDFNKYEDDMNGRRLQQLTNLFPHHANEVVRYLEAIHVLISRKGHYGKYLSINFNFFQWGKEECDGVITNDPTIVLDEVHFLANNVPEQEEKVADKSIEKPENQAFEPNSSLAQQNIPHANTQADYSQDLLKDLLTAIGRIEGNVNNLSKQQDDVEKTTKHLVTTALQEAFTANTLKQQKNLEKTVERLITKALQQKAKQAVETPVTAATNKPIIEAVIEAETPTPNDNSNNNTEKPKPNQCIVTTPPTKSLTEDNKTVSNSTALRFPPQLNQDQCYDVKKLLQRVDNDNAQLLLDMLTKRLRNTSNPVKNPIAYLTNLLERLNNNQLDIPCTAGSTASTEPRPLRESERRQAAYQEAVADCMQMEQNVKLLAKKDNMTFHECLKKFELKDLWQTIRDRFTAAKEALAEIQHLNGMALCDDS